MWASFFRSRNHTLHLPFYLRICVGVSLCFRCLWALFFRTRNIACLFVYLCWPLKCLGVSLSITHFIRLFVCVFVLGFRYVCGLFFLERGILPVYLCNCVGRLSVPVYCVSVLAA